MSIRSVVLDLFEAGVYTDLPEAEKKRIRLLNRLMVLAAFVMLIFGVVDIVSGYYEVTLTTLLVILVGGLQQWLVRQRYYTTAKHLSFWLMMATLLGMCLAVGNQAGGNYFLVPLCMFPLLVFSSRITAFIHFVLIFGSFVAVVFAQQKIEPLLVLPPHLVTPYILVAAFNMMLITYLFTSYARSVNESYEKMILEKSDQLAEAYKDITDSITYAKRIQDAYLPDETALTRHFKNSFLLFKPKDIVSGDFYWFYCPDEGSNLPGDEMYIAVADCTGHGVPGAIMSVICCNALNEVVITRGLRSCHQILDEVREAVIRMLKSNSVSSQKDGMDITLVKINKKTRELNFSGANNPLWIIKNSGVCMEFKPDKQPIGMYEGMKPFTLQHTHLEEGDGVFLFSDGYADQFGGPKGKKFKYFNLQKLFRENFQLEPNDLKQKLMVEFDAWRGELEQVDDVCIIGIRV